MGWALALMVSVPFVCSCEGNDPDAVEPGLEVRTNPMPAGSSQQFLSVQASGDWKITIQDQSGGALGWLAVSPESGSGSKANVRLSVEANAGEQPRTAVIVLNAGKSRATLALTQTGTSSGGDNPGGGDNPDPGTGDDPGVAKAGWLELPAVPENSGWGFFTHDMTLGSVRTRNYSFSWDYDNLVAPWVAYPLCKWNIGGNIKRTDAWGLDPKLPRNKQPVVFKGFSSGNDGWKARGHQIPSADRLYNYDANSQTFYGTNMTPQIQDGFNGDIWANLEGKVRSWAGMSDTLYVVTGCATKGSTKYCLDNDGKKITIPTAYYKAVLRYTRSSTTLGFNGYMGCAVWLDHKVYSNKAITSAYGMSIDELEEKTGIDFFANLPAVVGEETAAKIEAQDPRTISWWW